MYSKPLLIASWCEPENAVKTSSPAIWMTLMHFHLCAFFIYVFDFIHLIYIKFRVNALCEHIKCNGEYINVSCAFAVAEQSAFNTLCTGKQSKLTCGYSRSSVVMRMNTDYCTIFVWQVAAKIFDLVCIAVRGGHFHGGRQIKNNSSERQR